MRFFIQSESCIREIRGKTFESEVIIRKRDVLKAIV